ncbi:unnamed protein product [Durusdinium trenchii]|uniref:Uncharacterized protein n=2 Tax=Durusdinium trenchii TaxID=1381693 RepID=A0ABP0KXY6_9DINO
MARRSCLGSAIVVLLLSCSLSFVPGPARWPAWAAASACLAPAAAWAQEKQDWITMMMKDATEEEDPRKINLGEYQGDAPYYVFATVGSIFFAVTVWQSWQDTFGGGLGEKPPTTADDYFNPDFDPYKGMNIKRDPETGEPVYPEK